MLDDKQPQGGAYQFPTNSSFSTQSNSSRSSNAEADPGFVMRPPSFSHQTASPALDSQGDGAPLLKFTKNRSQTKKCARIVMYMGYLLMILDILGVVFVLLEMFGSGQHHKMVKRRREHRQNMIQNQTDGGKHQKEFNDDEIFSFGQQLGIDFIKLLHATAIFAQGWFMVRATKVVIRQIKIQERNPRVEIQKYADKVASAFKAIIMLVVCGLLIKAVANLYAFVVVDNFFEEQFKDDYKEWKNDARLQYMNPNELKVEKERWEKMDEIEGWWSIFGPTAMMIDLALTACCCSCVLYCFNSFKKGLVEFEESPNNPSFSNY